MDRMINLHRYSDIAVSQEVVMGYLWSIYEDGQVSNEVIFTFGLCRIFTTHDLIMNSPILDVEHLWKTGHGI